MWLAAIAWLLLALVVVATQRPPSVGRSIEGPFWKRPWLHARRIALDIRFEVTSEYRYELPPGFTILPNLAGGMAAADETGVVFVIADDEEALLHGRLDYRRDFIRSLGIVCLDDRTGRQSDAFLGVIEGAGGALIAVGIGGFFASLVAAIVEWSLTWLAVGILGCVGALAIGGVGAALHLGAKHKQRRYAAAASQQTEGQQARER